MLACTATSSADVISSQIRSSGSAARARGDRDSLLLAAAQLTGHPVADARREMDLLEELGDPCGLVVA